MLRPDPEDAPALVFDPLADLFFSVVAIVVLAVIIILPTIRLQASKPPEAKAPPTFEIDGHAVSPIHATSAGLIFGPDGASSVALNAIGDDPALAASLTRAQQGGTPLLVLIEPDGDEAAFQLEPVLARAGATSVTQVRLEEACGHMRAFDPQKPCPVPSKALAAP